MRKTACLSILSVAFFLAGCKTLEVISQVGTSVAVATGTITQQQASSINKSAAAVGKTLDTITPEQEYYIGRAVAATILKTYKPYDNRKANDYLNVMGKALALASDKPQTFGGYHFLALDTPEVNAFAAPGGLILVTRGLLQCCPNEDAVAAVLAHEVAHVQLAHGINAIKKGRITSALTTLATESAKSFGGQQLADLTTAFEGSITDITATLVNSGYSRKQEYEADTVAVEILRRVGYNPAGLREMLGKMAEHVHAGDQSGFGKTHPDPKDRIAELQSPLRNVVPVEPPAARKSRFDRALSGV